MGEQPSLQVPVEGVGSFRTFSSIHYLAFLLAVAYSALPTLVYWVAFAADGGGSIESMFAISSTLQFIVRPIMAVGFFVIFYYLGKRPELWQDTHIFGVLVYGGVALGSLADLLGVVTTTTGSGTVTGSTFAFNLNGSAMIVLLVEAVYGFGLLFGGAAIASVRTLWPGGVVDHKASARIALLASSLVFLSFLATAAALWLLYQVQLPVGLFPIDLAPLAGDFVLPVLFLLLLYLAGTRAYLLNGYAVILAHLIVGCVAGGFLGVVAQGYVESLVFRGFTHTSLLSPGLFYFAAQQGVAASPLGFSAVYLGESRRRSSGMVPSPSSASNLSIYFE